MSYNIVSGPEYGLNRAVTATENVPSSQQPQERLETGFFFFLPNVAEFRETYFRKLEIGDYILLSELGDPEPIIFSQAKKEGNSKLLLKSF